MIEPVAQFEARCGAVDCEFARYIAVVKAFLQLFDSLLRQTALEFRNDVSCISACRFYQAKLLSRWLRKSLRYLCGYVSCRFVLNIVMCKAIMAARRSAVSTGMAMLLVEIGARLPSRSVVRTR